MKKIYVFLMLALSMLGFAQNDVTFIVDMTQYAGSTANGVFVNGTFNNWCGSCNAMSDADGDSIWTVTLPITDSTFEYKFTVDGWNSAESFQDTTLSCIQPGPYYLDPTNCGGYCINRYAAITGDTILPSVAWNSCSGVPPTQQNYTFQIDLSGRPGDSAFIRGAAFNSWAMPGLPMTDDDGDSIWELTLSLLPGEYEYKFSAGANGASAVEESLDTTITASCTKTTGIYTNRLVTVVAGADSTLDVNCWEECGPCANIGIEEEAAAFVVKPNPASDVLFIEAAAGASKVAVYSVTGALVMEQSFDSSARLDVAALPRGMYIVRVQNGSDERVVRVALK